MMLQILKAEWIYHRVFLGAALVFTTLHALTERLYPDAKLAQFSWMLPMLVLVLVTTRNGKERRERYYLSLPVSLNRIATARFCVVLSLYLGTLLLFFLVNTSILRNESLWAILAGNFLVLSSYLFSIIFQDIQFCEIKRYQVIFWSGIVIYIGFILTSVVLALIFKEERTIPYMGSLILDSPILPVWCFLPVPALFYPSIIAFNQRRSYLGIEA